MFSNLFSKAKFSKSSDYWTLDLCTHSFHTGYRLGNFHANNSLDKKYNFLQFQHIDTDGYQLCKKYFLEALREPEITVNNSKSILSYLSMHRGFTLGLSNAISQEEINSDSKYYCSKLFAVEYEANIKNEYLALCADKGAFLLLRNHEYESEVLQVKNVEIRIKRRTEFLRLTDQQIIEFSTKTSKEVLSIFFKDLPLPDDVDLLPLRLASYVLFYSRLMTDLGDVFIYENLATRFTNDKFDADILELKISSYLNFAIPVCHVTKRAMDKGGVNRLEPEDEKLVVENFNQLIYDNAFPVISAQKIFQILDWIDEEAREFSFRIEKYESAV